MSKLKIALNQIENKVSTLVQAHQSVVERNDSLEKEKKELIENLDIHKNEIKRLNQVGKENSSDKADINIPIIESESGNVNSTRIRKKVEELVREIDRCIDVLK